MSLKIDIEGLSSETINEISKMVGGAEITLINKIMNSSPQQQLDNIQIPVFTPQFKTASDVQGYWALELLGRHENENFTFVDIVDHKKKQEIAFLYIDEEEPVNNSVSKQDHSRYPFQGVEIVFGDETHLSEDYDEKVRDIHNSAEETKCDNVQDGDTGNEGVDENGNIIYFKKNNGIVYNNSQNNMSNGKSIDFNRVINVTLWDTVLLSGIAYILDQDNLGEKAKMALGVSAIIQVSEYSGLRNYRLIPRMGDGTATNGTKTAN